ncbi:cell division protein FtsW [Clostridium sp. CAG:465]|nr:cell division protein FtsW [Clostridium sp. CAG:465]
MKKLKLITDGSENNEKDTKNNLDFGMLITIIILLCAGIVMVASASSYYALSNYNNSNYFLVRQLFFGIIGFIFMIIISNIDYKRYKKWGYLFYIICLVLLVLVLTPLGQTRNGAKRWLGFGALVFQPSEIMKIGLVIGMSTYLSLNYKKLNSFKGYIIPILMLLLVVIVMFMQKHLSGTIVMFVAACSIIFVSGIKVKARYIIAGIIAAAAMLAVFIFMPSGDSTESGGSFRLDRIVSFLNPEEDIKGGNWQAAQSLYAIGSGGIFGRGLGQSRQKYLWLPEAQNDFIFSVLGEELGLVGTVTVLALFSFFIYRGYRIAITARDMYGSLLATGITSAFALQILVNIAVVTCTVPVTGMPLPFFSYGGTALFINLCAMGILLNISRTCRKN